MLRVLSVLVALSMLTPQGVCLRKFDGSGWFRSTPVPTTTTSPTRAEPETPEVWHPATCRCGCHEQAAQDQEAAEPVGDAENDLLVRDGPAPRPEAPCCPTICKSKLDKTVPAEFPPPCEAAAFVGFLSVPARIATAALVLVRIFAHVHSPPRYLSFCTFLI
jgi:hypothetical protein